MPCFCFVWKGTQTKVEPAPCWVCCHWPENCDSASNFHNRVIQLTLPEKRSELDEWNREEYYWKTLAQGIFAPYEVWNFDRRHHRT